MVAMIYETRMGVHHQCIIRAASGGDQRCFGFRLDPLNLGMVRRYDCGRNQWGLRNDDYGPESYLDAGTP
jgi:hypothetical protein